MSEAPDAQQPEQKQIEVQLRVERMYVKDLSFESPGAPSIFSGEFQPKFQVDLNTSVNSLGDDRHEVVLSVTTTASRTDDRVAYIAEVHQAGIFEVKGVEGAALQQVVSIACPNMLFPYVREALDSLIVKGGFQPLQLAPVNFEQLYMQAVANRKNEATGEPGQPDDKITH
ncbi:MAG: protein-export chaperone SecB [Pseudomonadota bacterium]